MAGTAVLERTSGMATPVADRFMSLAEAEHKKNIADNYRKLRFNNVEDYNSALDGDFVSDTATLEREPAASVYAPAYNSMPAMPAMTAAPAAPAAPAEQRSDAAARIAQFRTVENAPSTRHDLFADVTFKDGVLQGAPVRQQAETAQVSAQAVAQAEPAAPAAEDEDALPTRRTMDTLVRPAAVATVETARPRFLSALSTRAKIALAVVVAVVVVALLLIGINTSIINSMSAQITAKETELQGLVRATEQVEGEIADMTTPENVAQWAEDHGMTLGD